MPTLTQIYEQYRHGAFYRTLGRWLQREVEPWTLGEMRMYMEPDYLSWQTDICIRVELLPDEVFWYSIQSKDLLGLDNEHLLILISEAFRKWFYSIRILPEDNVELGEN